MPAIDVQVRRLSVISPRPFDEVVTTLTATFGQPDVATFRRDLSAASTPAELERVVRGAVGSSELMEFARFDLGEVLGKEEARAPRILRLVVGNPLVMKEMVRTTPDAAS